MKKGAKQEITKKSEEVEEYWECQEELSFKDARKKKKKRFQLRCQNCRNFLALSVFLFLPFPIYFDF
jgi:hypothetical protein